MTENQLTVTRAYWALGDYFTRLGGSGRYFNMPESDIPLYIGCQLAKRAYPEFPLDEYLSSELLQAAMPALPEVQKCLSGVCASPEQLATLIYDFVLQIDTKYKPQHRSSRWECFIAWASDVSEGN